MIGKIRIKFSGGLSGTITNSLNNFIESLKDKKIDIDKADHERVDEIIIEVERMGDISDKHLREPLKILFGKRKDFQGLTIKLISDNKEFVLPNAIEEAIDWFTIE